MPSDPHMLTSSVFSPEQFKPNSTSERLGVLPGAVTTSVLCDIYSPWAAAHLEKVSTASRGSTRHRRPSSASNLEAQSDRVSKLRESL